MLCKFTATATAMDNGSSTTTTLTMTSTLSVDDRASLVAAYNTDLSEVRDKYRSKLATLQQARNRLSDEYEDLYDTHQMLLISSQGAEMRQDEDAQMISVKSKRCKELEAEVTRSQTRIEELEFALAADESPHEKGPAVKRVRSASVLWWKERCILLRTENQALGNQLSLFSDEACPMMCERPFTHNMQCCGSKICGTCLQKWSAEQQHTQTAVNSSGTSCPYCRASPSLAVIVDRSLSRPGTAKNPINIS